VTELPCRRSSVGKRELHQQPKNGSGGGNAKRNRRGRVSTGTKIKKKIPKRRVQGGGALQESQTRGPGEAGPPMWATNKKTEKADTPGS